MKKFLSVAALTAGLVLAGGTAAQASPEYPTKEACEAAGFIWADTFCYTRQANNPDPGNGTAPKPQPSAEPTPTETAVPTPVPTPTPVLTAEPTAPTLAPEPVYTAPPAPPVYTAPVVPEVQTGPAVTPAPPTELAYTGVEEVALASGGLVLGLAGVAMVRWSLRKRRDEA